tara:strand:- start:4669 stop:4977 length:309 start_codon:yes stop_codon:yes gene_type:complete
MNLTIVESTANPSRLWIVEVADQTAPVEGTDCVYDYQFTRPVTLVGGDIDHLLISSLKMLSGNLTGFDSWQEAATILASIPDVEAAAIAHGTTLNTLLHNVR